MFRTSCSLTRRPSRCQHIQSCFLYTKLSAHSFRCEVPDVVSSDKMWTNQTAVAQPRLIASQLPCGLKYSSSSSGIPIMLLWANKIGISSTRSVVPFSCSLIPTPYRIFKILSPFDRTMSLCIKRLFFNQKWSILSLVITYSKTRLLQYQ